MKSLKNEFLLDPSIHFLNHGSFGATPRVVLDAYQEWQVRLERQPVLFLSREFDGLMREARIALGRYLNADADDLVYITNATHGANIVARSVDLEPGDEVLSTDHEYGACDDTWEFVCSRRGANYIRHTIPLPLHSEQEIVDQFWRAVTSRTRVIYLSHYTSSTAFRMPVEEVCRRARELGIITVIDAAHSPGQIPVDLRAMDGDFVFGNCHKWMLSPKGAGFLYVRRDLQRLIKPLVVSWGYNPEYGATTGSRYVDFLQWTGTRDPAAALAVPAAIDFMEANDWVRVRRECHQLLQQAIERICDLIDQSPLYPLDSAFYSQMGVAPIPPCDLTALKGRLYDEYGVEVPIIEWKGRFFVRISVQAYNTQEDIDILVDSLRALLSQ